MLHYLHTLSTLPLSPKDIIQPGLQANSVTPLVSVDKLQPVAALSLEMILSLTLGGVVGGGATAQLQSNTSAI